MIEAAGSARAVEEGVTLVRDGGRYVIAGHYTDVGPSSINAHHHINRKHLEIRGCWGSESRHFLEAIQILEEHGSVPWREIGARTYPLSALNEALADAEAMRITKALVDPWAEWLSLRAISDQLTASETEPRTSNPEPRAPNMRHTKIIATLGPASASREIIAALVTAGVDVFRLNFSHGNHDSHAESFARIREIARDAGRHVGIMQDLSGPKIRTGPLAGDRPLPLTAGETIVLASGHAPSQPGRIFTPVRGTDRVGEERRQASPR